MLATLLKRVISVRDEEVTAMLIATFYGFLIMLSYYIVRAVRDEISSADRGNLQYLWTAVFLVMLLAVPLYSWAVSRLSRGVFIPLANRFFAVNLVLFYGALILLPESARPWIDRVFYVWTSVFALFVVTVFWGFVTDLFANEQGKRLFGFIAVGASLGGVAGSSVPAFFAAHLPVFTLILIAIIPLEIAARCAWFLHRNSSREGSSLRRETQRVGGTWISGIPTVFRSPYLRRIALFVALMTFASTVLYFVQANLVAEAISDRGERRELYGRMDLAVNVITIVTQGFLFAHIVRWLGIGITLAAIPTLVLAGFAGLGLYPTLMVLVVVHVLYRAGRYALTKPAREVLFTVVSREERYKSKAFIDAAVYRGGDLVSGWAYAGLAALGLSVAAICLVAAPVAVVWALTGFNLGRRQEQRVGEQQAAPEAEAPSVAPAPS